MKKRLLLVAVIVVAAMSFIIAGCSTTTSEPPTTGDTKVVTNLDGTEITVPTTVERVGAIFGPSYEKIFMLNAEDKIVCDGDFHIDDWPWSNVIYKRVNDVPGIPNAHSELNIEDLMNYNLDVVFNFPNPETTSAMEEVGIGVVPMASTGKLSDLKDTVTLYAEVLGGDAPEIAARYAQYFDEKVKMISDVTAKIADADKHRVYFSNQEILWTAGNQSDMVELIELAGGICVAADVAGGSKTEITQEQLLEWNPEYIFVDHAGSSGNAPAEEVIKSMLDAEEYQQIDAVKNNNIYISPTGVFFWDSGVQKPLMLMWMAQTMYPELFPDLDLKAELKSFYSEFFRYDLSDEEADKILAHQNP